MAARSCIYHLGMSSHLRGGRGPVHAGYGLAVSAIGGWQQVARVVHVRGRTGGRGGRSRGTRGLVARNV